MDELPEQLLPRLPGGAEHQGCQTLPAASSHAASLTTISATGVGTIVNVLQQTRGRGRQV